MGASVSCSDCIPDIATSTSANGSKATKTDKGANLARITKNESVSLVRKSNRDLNHHIDQPVALVASLNDSSEGVYFDAGAKALTGAEYIVFPMAATDIHNNIVVAPGRGNADNGKYVCFIEAANTH
jgi:hypothetical protein